MRFYTVWVFFVWKNFLMKLFKKIALLRALNIKIMCWLLKHGNYRWFRWFLWFAEFVSKLGLSSRQDRKNAYVALANKQSLLNVGHKLDYVRLSQRRRLLELSGTFGQNPQVLAQLEACKAQLNAVIEPLHRARERVVLAPLHMVSDVLAGIVGGGVYPGKATVIVSVGSEITYSEEDRQRGGVNLTYCSIHDDGREIADNLMKAIIETKKNKQNIIIFPDITPDYTMNVTTSNTKKLRCQLFGRPANLHTGVIRIARAMSAKVVFFFLYYDDGIKINILPAVPEKDLEKKLPVIIEASISQRADDWLLWNSHSLFFVNE